MILDFGLVVDRTSARMSTEDHVVGTAAYMAPEQASGAAIDAAADWYAFGIVTYEALTGTVPFEGSGLQMLLDKVRLTPEPPHLSVPRVPLDLDAIYTELLRFERVGHATAAAEVRSPRSDCSSPPSTRSTIAASTWAIPP